MHPTLGAHLSGMGEHGIVNLQSHASKGQLCWKFQLSVMHVKSATIRDKSGMKVATLGHMYSAHGCAMVAKNTLDKIEDESRLLPRLGRDARPRRRLAREAVRRHGAHVDGRAARHARPEACAAPLRPRDLPRNRGGRRLVALVGQDGLESGQRCCLAGRGRDRADPADVAAGGSTPSPTRCRCSSRRRGG